MNILLSSPPRLGGGAPTQLITDADEEDEDLNFLVEESAPPPPDPEPSLVGLSVNIYFCLNIVYLVRSIEII